MLKYKQYKNMKTKMKRQGSTELPRFAVGALAIAGASAANGAIVQITLTGNKISTTGGGNQLVADLTGDTVADVTIANPFLGPYSAKVLMNGNWLSARRGGTSFYVDAQFAAGGVGVATASARGATTATYLNPITFADRRINGGATTQGWVQVKAFNNSDTSHTVELGRLIFDDANTTRPAFASIPGAQTAWSAVPEPSSLGLLALGAGGLLARRRRAMAA
jgi:hypothetical protein